MSVVMVYPDFKSEKGISKYSLDLINNIKKQGMSVKEVTFLQGQPKTLLRKMQELKNYDIIHLQHEYNLLGHYGMPYFFIFTYLKIFKKNKLITTMHTVLSQSENISGGKIKVGLRKIFYKIKNWLIKKSSDRIIVHSEHFRKILIKEYGFDKNQVITVPHAILENIKIPNRNKSRNKLKLKGKNYLLIGTMVPDHGHDIIIGQANKIGKNIIVATNPSKVNFRNEKKIKSYLKLNQQIVKEGKFQEYVRFDLGEIPYSKWWEYFSASDLILLPYRGGIGSGIFSDAMAAKKPVVSSNIPYFKEIAKRYKCLEIAKENSDFPRAIRKAMNKNNYNKMVNECKKYAKENSLTEISKRYKYIYNSLK